MEQFPRQINLILLNIGKKMILSSYHSAFNLIKNNFDYSSAIDNYCSFFDEVVIAVNTSEDNTFNVLSNLQSKYSNLKILSCEFSYDDYAFDGKIKNFALQNCLCGDFFCLLDLDERIPLWQKDLWRTCSLELNKSNYDCLLIASINLCKDIYHYKDIGYKFYLHKKGFYRGIWNGARKDNGKIDITRSDTCEIIDKEGNLAKCYPLSNKIEDLRTGNFPYVFHYYAVDFEQRIKQNEVWTPVWSNRAGYQINDIILNKENLEKIPIFEHNLLIK